MRTRFGINFLFPAAICAVIFFCFVVQVSAHATPVEYEPSRSEVHAAVPDVVAIRFTERVESALSQITVQSPDGDVVSDSESTVDPANPRRLEVPINAEADGVYTVVWRVVSADDGHFTRGVFTFAVGDNTALPTQDVGHTHVEYVGSLSETLASSIELFGHGILWAVLFWLVLVRRLGEWSQPYVACLCRTVKWVVVFGAVLTLGGAAGQLYTTAVELMNFHEISLLAAVWLYVQTSLGAALLSRMGAVVVFVCMLSIGWRWLWKEGGVAGLILTGATVSLLVFAYFRASVSHATADLFYPSLSVMVNMIHVIEKDIWVGLLALLLVLHMVTALRPHFEVLFAKIYWFLNLNLLGLTLTASYIIWLHLKSFSNLTTTVWGESLQYLVVAAGLLVAMHIATQVLWYWYPKILTRLLTTLLTLQIVLGCIVIYASSAIMLVSPPPVLPAMQSSEQVDDSTMFVLESNRFEDTVWLSLNDVADLRIPVVLVSSLANPDVVNTITPEIRFFDGYEVHRRDFIGAGPWKVEVIVNRIGAYDTTAEFVVDSTWFTDERASAHGREFDTYTVLWITGAAIVVLLLVIFAFWSRWVLHAKLVLSDMDTSHSFWKIVVGLCVAAWLIIFGFELVRALAGNPAKTLCEQSGHEWHVMQLQRSGEILSESSFEGCMAANGRYHVTDEREIEYLIRTNQFKSTGETNHGH